MKSLLSIFAVCIALIFPNLSLGQAPNLRTASSYALFTVTGAFTNTGASMVTGNIGTNAGALTGFPPGIITGITNVANAASLQAATDVSAAYAELTAAACTAPIVASLAGLTLTPGVYCQSGPASASDLTGVLTLDGGGNPNAVFIIKLSGAFSTATGSSIVLTNGASFENVYFQVDGAVNMGINSVFKGTVMANGAISLLTGARLQGRGLSIAGAINTNANLVNGTPDLTPSVFSNGGTYNQNQQKDVVIAIYNVSATPTTAPITWEVNKISPAFTMSINPNATSSTVVGHLTTMTNGDWTATEQATRWVFTLKDNLSIPANGNMEIVVQVSAIGSANGAATITARVFNGTGGGEAPITNNSAVFLLSINDNN